MFSTESRTMNSVNGNVLQNVWLPGSDCSWGSNVWFCVILINFNGSAGFLDTGDHTVEFPASGILEKIIYYF